MPDNKILLKNLEKTDQTEGHKRGMFEQLGVDEEKKEQEKTGVFEKVKTKVHEQEISVKEKIVELGGIIATSNAQRKKQQRKEQIEKILEKDLEDIYLNMSSEKQKEFKIAGEKTTEEINNLLDKAKIKIRKIISLIKKWLSIIPGINKFFLEQEAKIKADAIIKIKQIC